MVKVELEGVVVIVVDFSNVVIDVLVLVCVSSNGYIFFEVFD